MKSVSSLNVRRLTVDEASVFSSMTFPVYRPLLSLQESVRHPEQGDKKRVRPVAVGAYDGEDPVGLALAEVTRGEASPSAELLSVFARADRRREGIGRSLVEAIERTTGEDGARRIQAVYMTGKPSIPLVERILSTRGWSEPTVRTLTVRFTPEEAARTPWFQRFQLGDNYVVFPWTELKPEEEKALIESQTIRPWISPGLEAWRHTQHGFDSVSSIGVRYQGTVVGWVINHPISPGRVRFTCSYIRKDLGRRGRILPLFSESIRRLAASGGTMGTFITPVAYETMIRFIRRRCEPWASFVGETRSSEKRLGGDDVGS